MTRYGSASNPWPSARVAAFASDPPDPEAVEQTLAAIWSDLFSLLPDTALEDDAEKIAYVLPSRTQGNNQDSAKTLLFRRPLTAGAATTRGEEAARLLRL